MILHEYKLKTLERDTKARCCESERSEKFKAQNEDKELPIAKNWK